MPRPFLLLPLFVVITTAPFKPREPYSAVAAAPFNTETDSKSSGFKFFSSLPQSVSLALQSASPFLTALSRITPSTT